MLKLLLLAVIVILGIVCSVKSYKMKDTADGKVIYACSLGITVLSVVIFVMCLMHHMKK
jgi:hypothetical protein